VWTALVRPGAKLKPGRRVTVAADLDVEILDVLDDGTRRVQLHSPLPARTAIERHGRVPLPPYIERADDDSDRERYQTVYSRTEGSVAAPTAGLHFTPGLLDALVERGVHLAKIVLHVGVGTFRPVEVEDPAGHVMHAEWYSVAEAEAARMNAARRAGGRLWAVGTTVTRTLESVAAADGSIRAGEGWTRLFIRPGHDFRAVDRLITNFHLPRSTLIMLVSAFAGYERTRAAYAEAVREGYRFYSYGDAMVIL
jgi:S-adenosylmethionine:tRNA ribosyltransferase-isomerase